MPWKEKRFRPYRVLGKYFMISPLRTSPFLSADFSYILCFPFLPVWRCFICRSEKNEKISEFFA